MAYQSKNHRKFLATSLTAAMVATAVAPAAGFAAEVSFPDVSDSHWAKDAISYLVGKGALEGRPDGNFDPSASITRGEAAKILAISLGLEIDEDAKASFKDIPTNHWASKYVAAIENQTKDVINGYTDGTFKVNDSITRQEMAKMIATAYGLEFDEDAVITDFSDNTSWGADTINTLVSLGIVEGLPGGKFGTQQDVTRAQTAVFVHRAEVEGVRVEVEKKYVAPEVVSSAAVADNKVVVTFNTEIKDVDHTNFSLTGDKAVTKAELSSDKKSVTLTLNSSLVDGYEYTVTATGIVSAKGLAAEGSLKTTLKYEIAKVGKPTLSKRTFEPGQNVKSAVVVKDEAGKTISADLYKITGIDVSVAGVLDENGKVLNNETSANVRVTVTMYTGEVITGDYETITVTPVALNTDMVKAAFTERKNAVHAQRTSVDTKLAVNETDSLYVYTKDAKGNPEDDFLDLQDSYKVKNLTPTVIDVVDVNTDGTLSVKGLKVGEAKLEITHSNGFKEVVSFDVVKANNAYADLAVAPVSGQLIKANSVNGTDFEEDVDQKTIDIGWIDQDGDVTAVDFTGASTELLPTAKQTLTTGDLAQEGDKLVVSTQSDAVTFAVDEDGDIQIQTKNNVKAQNVKVTISYFKAGATSATTTKTVNVAIKDTNAVHAKYAVEQVGSLDAESEDTHEVSFKVYSLDSKGTKIDDVTEETTFEFVGSLPANVDHWIGEVSDNTVGFDEASKAENLLNYNGSFKLEYTVGSTDPDGEFTVDFTNTKDIQKSAKVSTSPVVVDVNDSSVTVNELVFGKASESELLVDSEGFAFGVRVNEDGYKYNKPIVSVLSKSNAALTQGANVYGITAPDYATDVIEYAFDDTQGVDFEYRIVNASSNLSNDAGKLSVTSGSKATFQLVIDAIYMEDETREDSLKTKEANLLAEPVIVDVTLTK
ncbi:S-layer homology domain-containing protein [Bacillus sp. ISL-47]|uniref:S-layer homology domain-containing protein n=1 Tax=Bacillus sp. ISL-47 TaxID=2819130 RepID=UPI001BE70A0E|nr:S-layer homology domain-containing protein [Bacillus sp. ISL-47]MBT2689208.1 S-layer homology domain-containing protein [Bacillus sp. ISL-47]MBT2708671.1 S-layer homology domain-containing protein [Pseudomonas sp. ISL-84]